MFWWKRRSNSWWKWLSKSKRSWTRFKERTEDFITSCRTKSNNWPNSKRQSHHFKGNSQDSNKTIWKISARLATIFRTKKVIFYNSTNRSATSQPTKSSNYQKPSKSSASKCRPQNPTMIKKSSTSPPNSGRFRSKSMLLRRLPIKKMKKWKDSMSSSEKPFNIKIIFNIPSGNCPKTINAKWCVFINFSLHRINSISPSTCLKSNSNEPKKKILSWSKPSRKTKKMSTDKSKTGSRSKMSSKTSKPRSTATTSSETCAPCNKWQSKLRNSPIRSTKWSACLSISIALRSGPDFTILLLIHDFSMLVYKQIL